MAAKEAKLAVLDNDIAGSRDRLDPTTLVVIAGPEHAEVARVHDDHIHYQPVKGFTGADEFRYRICTASGACSEATVVITVG